MVAEQVLPPTLSPPAGALPPTTAMGLEAFLAWQPEPSGLKFEWKDGEVLFGEDSMQQQEYYIVSNLVRRFASTKAFSTGCLLNEADCYLPAIKAVRRPDVAYFTDEQVREGKAKKNPVPAWVSEIVSKNDLANYHEDKLRDYFASGVRLVWQIFPDHLLVRAWRSLGDMTLARGSDPLSAAPVVEDLAMTADDLFRVP